MALDPLTVWRVLPTRMPGMVPSVIAGHLPERPSLDRVVAVLEEMVAAGHVIRRTRRGHDVYYRGMTPTPATSSPAVGDSMIQQTLWSDADPAPTAETDPGASIVADAGAVFARLAALPEGDRTDVINAIKLALREHSPQRREPVDCVIWIDPDRLHANDYNPNTVAPPEMRLLQRSIMQDGYTQPIVAWPDADGYEVVDGFHRNRVGREVAAVRKRTGGRLPISVINADRTGREDRIAATIRHNRARGVHQVDGMSDIVLDLVRRGRSDEWIAKELGMEPDEVLRLKQVQGMAELFADRDFSEAWEVA